MHIIIIEEDLLKNQQNIKNITVIIMVKNVVFF